MAAQLKEAYGGEAIRKYQKQGLFVFFNDFVEISRKWSLQKKAFTFSHQFIKLFSQWYRDWTGTYTDYARDLVITPDIDIKEIESRLKKDFTNARVYPGFSLELDNIGREFLLQDKVDKAFEIFTACVALYPDSPDALGHLGLAHLWKGNIDMARTFLKKAFKINPEHGAVNPRWLRWMAYRLVENKKAKAAFGLASIALELYPGNARVIKGVGDIYLEAGEKRKSH
jgi:tetratricopeptide (TPR) repeat protein